MKMKTNLHIPLRSDPGYAASANTMETLQKMAGIKITPATMRLYQWVVAKGWLIQSTHVKPWFKLISP